MSRSPGLGDTTEGEVIEAEDPAPEAHEKAEALEGQPDRMGVTEPEQEFRRRHADQFLNPMNRLTQEVRPFTAPEKLVERVNPDYETGEPYQSNCADCARCFERSWRGHVEEAGGRSYEVNTQHDPELPGLYVQGEPSAMTEEWAGREMREVTSSELAGVLEREGAGSSAVVHTRWTDSEGHKHGHAYNVVNDRGEIKVVDPQTCEVLPFQNGSIRPRISSVSAHQVLIWDAKGRPVA